MRTVRKLVPSTAAPAIESILFTKKPNRLVAKHLFIFQTALNSGAWTGKEVAAQIDAVEPGEGLELPETSDEDYPQECPPGAW